MAEAAREARLVFTTHWTVFKTSNGTITDDITHHNIHTDWVISTAAQPEINKSIMHLHMIASSIGSWLYFWRKVLHYLQNVKGVWFYCFFAINLFVTNPHSLEKIHINNNNDNEICCWGCITFQVGSILLPLRVCTDFRACSRDCPQSCRSDSHP